MTGFANSPVIREVTPTPTQVEVATSIVMSSSAMENVKRGILFDIDKLQTVADDKGSSTTIVSLIYLSSILCFHIFHA